MSNYQRMAIIVLLAAVTLVAVVSASMEESIFSVPLFEVGGLWLRAAGKLGDRASAAVWSIPNADMSSPWTYLALAATVVAVYYAYQLLFTPINRIKLLGDLGYIPDSKLPMKDIARRVQKNRLVGDIPPVYPNGWFSILETSALKKGQSTTVSCLGLNLAVFRGEDGQVYALDAYCPHMGANLGAGGRVIGNRVECPFHGWQFRGDTGKCTSVPYCDAKHIPETAKVKSWDVLERNGFIYLWYHAEGLDPQWMLPEIEEIARGEWKYRGRSEHFINAHIEEVPENGADVAHLTQLHGPSLTAGTDLRFTHNWFWSFIKHHWTGSWDADPENKHIGVLKLTHSIQLFGYKLFPVLDLKVEARQLGPGVVYLNFESPLFGRGAFLQSLTPVEPMTQRLIHHVHMSWFLPTVVGKFFLYAEALQVERDVMVWNNKRFESKPLLLRANEDSLIARHRRWYSQFYSEHSPRLTTRKDTLEW